MTTVYPLLSWSEDITRKSGTLQNYSSEQYYNLTGIRYWNLIYDKYVYGQSPRQPCLYGICPPILTQ